MRVDNSTFLHNTAASDRGGGIFVSNANIVLKSSNDKSVIAYNSAAIGGGIFYEKVFPDIAANSP
jgi:hypothetical protein